MSIDERNENRKKKVKDFLQDAENCCLPNEISTELNTSKENINGQKKSKVKTRKINEKKIEVRRQASKRVRFLFRIEKKSEK